MHLAAESIDSGRAQGSRRLVQMTSAAVFPWLNFATIVEHK
jgi:hypothetical protein